MLFSVRLVRALKTPSCNMVKHERSFLEIKIRSYSRWENNNIQVEKIRENAQLPAPTCLPGFMQKVLLSQPLWSRTQHPSTMLQILCRYLVFFPTQNTQARQFTLRVTQKNGDVQAWMGGFVNTITNGSFLWLFLCYFLIMIPHYPQNIESQWGINKCHFIMLSNMGVCSKAESR